MDELNEVEEDDRIMAQLEEDRPKGGGNLR
jgi:hypothetical protein